MWQIEEHRRIDKQLAGVVPIDVLKRYEKWKDIARLSGSQGLLAIKGFHDEALSGEWKGHRSSRLWLQWRVIYRVVANVLQIQVRYHRQSRWLEIESASKAPMKP